jgi:hypothetical protein
MLFALVLSPRISLEMLTKPIQGFSSRKGCVRPRSHNCTDSAHGIPEFTHNFSQRREKRRLRGPGSQEMWQMLAWKSYARKFTVFAAKPT